MLVEAALAFFVMGADPGPPHRNGPPPRLVERLNRMSPSERQGVLSKLPADRRALVEQRLEKLDHLPPDEKRRLRDEYTLFQQLPEEKQNEARRLFQEFSEMPDRRRAELRRELLHLRQMPPAKRARRIASGDFQREYDEKERGMLVHLLDVLPATRTEAPPSDPAPMPSPPESDR